MEGVKTSHVLPFHTIHFSKRIIFNRLFALIYLCAIFSLLYYHLLNLLHSISLFSSLISLSLLISDVVLAFMWMCTQSFHMRPVYREEFVENIKKTLINDSNFPALDVFVCTADPYKEPPMNVVNTALSVMAYEYPSEKISVYVSDDGGSAMTLFAFMEASKFAAHWLAFCRKNKVVERSPDSYFESNQTWSSEIENIKTMYESMRVKVENVLENGKVSEEYVTGERERDVLSKWTDGFTRHDHPTIIQVLLESSKDRDIEDHPMPNLIYVSRQKSRTSHHNFKAGALNALLRVSAVMTNAPIILTLDCDMYSNDPETPLRALCYLFDPKIKNKLGYVQFPQCYHGLNKDDIYGSELMGLFHINPVGMDGLLGPSYVGTGCFFNRRVFFGPSSSLELLELPDLNPNHVVDKPIRSQQILSTAHRVSSCDYENNTKWGSKVGFRYGSLVEDYYTGYRLQCEEWKTVFCHPNRSAFYGDVPINLFDVLSQNKRWAIGLLEVAFSKYSPVTFGVRFMGILMGLSYAYYAFWPIWSIPITIYAFLPQLTLVNGFTIFPKVSDPWFLLYVFLFVGAYGQDCLEFVIAGSTVKRWWNDQRMWIIRGLSSYMFGLMEFSLKSLGISTQGFNVTSKVIDDEQSKRYEQQMFDFGVTTPMFVPLTTAAIVNLVAFSCGMLKLLRGINNLDEEFVQMFITGFAIVNCFPIYEAMALRSDKGRLATKVTVISSIVTFLLFATISFIKELFDSA